MRIWLQRIVVALALTEIGCASMDQAVITKANLATQDLEGCQRSLAELHVRQAEQERLFRGTQAAQIYAEGKPIPQAEKDLSPGLELSLTQTNAKAPAFTLSCHTWVCKLIVKTEPGAGYGVGMIGNEQRIDGFMYDSAHADVDLATGKKINVATEWVLLRDPAGQERSRQELDEQARTAPPSPSELSECRALAEKQLDETAALRRKIFERRDNLPARFEASPPNEALTKDMAGEILHALALPERPASEVVTCRGRICQIELTLAPAQRKRLAENDGFTSQVDNQYETLSSRSTGGARRSPTDQLLYEMYVGPTRINGRRILERLMKELVAAESRCETLAPKRGAVTVEATLPAANDGAPSPKITLVYDGSALDTPYGRCVVQLADSKLGAATVPHPISGHIARHAFLFPPDPAVADVP